MSLLISRELLIVCTCHLASLLDCGKFDAVCEHGLAKEY